MFIEKNCFASIHNYFIHTPNVVCVVLYNIVECTNIVLHTYTMVKHTKCFLYEPDNFVNIKGFVGVKIALCMYTKYFACIQICTKYFVRVQNNIQIF